MPAIEFADVSKSFSRVTGQMLLRTHLRLWARRKHKERFWALKHISFQVDRGESLAVIGSNGAGKSTLLSLICGLARPDDGSVWVDGRVAALLELGSGFHPDLTGAENVRLNAALLGLSRSRTTDVFDDIVEFAGIREFIQEPLRTYSTGMVMRLAFAVATSLDPDVVVIDEVLAVGDQSFQAKCLDKIHQLRTRGKTLIIVSHDAEIVKRFCDRAIWLDHGQLMMNGPVWETLDAYSGGRAATR